MKLYILHTSSDDGDHIQTFYDRDSMEAEMWSILDAEWDYNAANHGGDSKNIPKPSDFGWDEAYEIHCADPSNTFMTTEEVDVDLSKATVSECWKRCIDEPGTFGVLYDYEEIETMWDGVEDGYDPDKHRQSLKKWCEDNAASFMDAWSQLLWDNTPSIEDLEVIANG